MKNICGGGGGFVAQGFKQQPGRGRPMKKEEEVESRWDLRYYFALRVPVRREPPEPPEPP